MRGCRCLRSYFLRGIKIDVNDKDIKMLKQMQIKRFTVFQEANLEFSPQLNVIVGENGTGKSHLLKLAYSLIATSNAAGRKSPDSKPSKTFLQKAYGEKLNNVFRPETLGRLATRKQGRERCEITLTFFDDKNLNTSISFAANSQTDVQVNKLPLSWNKNNSLFLPPRELMTIFPGFTSVYEGNYLNYEETLYDICVHLGKLLRKGIVEKEILSFINPIENVLGGQIRLNKNGNFYLRISGGEYVEMPLLAEGHRKLAMLARLIANGAIQNNSYVFFDEPESNLNPKLIKIVAKVIHELAMQGVQIFIATHSFFLLKEFDLLARQQPKNERIKQRFIGLHQSNDGGVQCEQADSLVELQNIVALDEELAQYDREMEVGVNE